jgi:hypothetical protein
MSLVENNIQYKRIGELSIDKKSEETRETKEEDSEPEIGQLSLF